MRLAVVHNLKDGGAHRRLAEQVGALGADIVEFTTSLATPVTARPYVVPLTIFAPARRYHVFINDFAQNWTPSASAPQEGRPRILNAID